MHPPWWRRLEVSSKRHDVYPTWCKQTESYEQSKRRLLIAYFTSAFLSLTLHIFNVITFIASLLRCTTQGNMTSQRERTVAEMTHAQPWLPSPTADPHSRDCYMNTSYSMHNTQSRLPVNDNDVITLGTTIGTFEAVVFFFLILIQIFHSICLQA